MAKALEALERYPDRLGRGIGKVGKLLDEKGFGGSLMIRATVFAYAGVEEKPFVEEQVDAALGGFEAVLDVASVEELVEEYKGKLVFKPNVQWPSIIILGCWLSHTHGARQKTREW